MDEEDLLDTLLQVTCEELEPPPKRTLTEADLFGTHSNTIETGKLDLGSSVVHSGDTDSSDDEGNRNYENQKYSDSGKEIKRLLNTQQFSHQQPTNKNQPSTSYQDVFIDPVFHMRIINPKITANALTSRMEGRVSVRFIDLPRQINMGSLKDRDWVICGVVVNKSPPKTTQKGSQFSIWTLTDLKDDIKTIALFMFNSAHTDLWKTLVGSVIGVLNPNILDKKDGSKDIATLSISSSQQVMLFGDSKDFGICKSMKKNGDKCTAIVNLSKCEYCIFHIKQEYQKCSKRSELQANFAGQGLVNLRNKVLGKSEVFYAGKSYTAIPAKKSQKLQNRDSSILANLSSMGNNQLDRPKQGVKRKRGAARQLDVNPRERARDLELLKKLGAGHFETKTNFSGAHSEEVSLSSSKAAALEVINKLKAKNSANTKPSEEVPENTLKRSEEDSKELKNTPACSKTLIQSGNSSTQMEVLNRLTMGVPILSNPGKNIINLSKPIKQKHVDRAKNNAIKYIQRNGPIKKLDPNSTKSTGHKKVQITTEEEAQQSKLQESEFISDRFKKMMALTTRHPDLLEFEENKAKEAYFQKLEGKERMEEKMSKTHKMACKAVRCLKCKYISFSASDLCKSERHPLKVCKRFNEVGGELLSRGFLQLEKRHAAIYRRVKSSLPRRESERKSHPLARHNDILQAVDTRLSMLNMTYVRYIDSKVVCFIPGKVLDETRNILNLLNSNQSPPRAHQLLQELRDLSSMAIEHFDEYILPSCKDELDRRNGFNGGFGALEYFNNSIPSPRSFQGPSFLFRGFAQSNHQTSPRQSEMEVRSPSIPTSLSNALFKAKKAVKSHKLYIGQLAQTTRRLHTMFHKQKRLVRTQSMRLRDQERRIREQTAKLTEQDAALTDIKKHMDEWEQKYKDLTAELVRARDDILTKTSIPSLMKATASNTTNYKSNIKPRLSQLLPKNYLGLDLERKRKSTISSDVPLKRNRSPCPATSTTGIADLTRLNIPDLVSFQKEPPPSKMEEDEKRTTRPVESGQVLSSFLDSFLPKNPLKSPRKRRMAFFSE